MKRCNREQMARSLAENKHDCYGQLVIDGFWYVGDKEQLSRIGAVRIFKWDDMTVRTPYNNESFFAHATVTSNDLRYAFSASEKSNYTETLCQLALSGF